MRLSTAALFLSTLASALSVANNRISCRDERSYGAGQIQVEEVSGNVRVKLRTADFYSARTEDLAQQLGVKSLSHMPIWAEAVFPVTQCERKSGTIVFLCYGNTTITFRNYFGNTALGSVNASAGFAIDTFTRDSISHILPNSNRVEGKLTVTTNVAYERSAVAEMSANDCHGN